MCIYGMKAMERNCYTGNVGITSQIRIIKLKIVSLQQEDRDISTVRRIKRNQPVNLIYFEATNWGMREVLTECEYLTLLF